MAQSIVGSILSGAGQQTPGLVDNESRTDENGQPIEVRRASEDNNAEHSSLKPPPLDIDRRTGKPNPAALRADTVHFNAPSVSAQDDEELRRLLSQVNPDDPTKWALTRHYAQTAGRTGFMYAYRDASGRDTVAKFDQGLFITDDIALTISLDKDIARAGGIGPNVRNITAAEYKTVLTSNRRYEALRANGGMAGSNNEPGYSQASNPDAMRLLTEENELLKQRLASMGTGAAGKGGETPDATPQAPVAEVAEPTADAESGLAALLKQ